jgi:hypothetical protein
LEQDGFVIHGVMELLQEMMMVNLCSQEICIFEKGKHDDR